MPLRQRTLTSMPAVPPKPAVQPPASSIVRVSAPPLVTKGGIKRRPAIVDTYVTIPGELGNVVAGIREMFSPSIITRANEQNTNYGRIPSGILTLDLALAGGIMLSRGSMLYGNRSAGKSTLAIRFIASVQRMFPDKYAVVIDFEGTFDRNWARHNGCDLERLLIVEPETGESGIDIADAMFRSEEVSLVITDSIAMITPMKELQNSAEDLQVGTHARVIGNYIRRLNSAMLSERHRSHYPGLLHLNQFRSSIGVTFGDPRVLPGGKALEFSTSQQAEVSNKEHFAGEKPHPKDKKAQAKAAAEPPPAKEGDTGKIVVYNEHSFKITKDKTGGRVKEGKYKLIRDESMGLPVGYVDQSKTIVQFGLATGVLSGSPQSFNHDDHRNWRGSGDFVQWLVENPEHERAMVGQIVEVYRERWGVS